MELSFERCGPENTTAALVYALGYARQNGIKFVVVASTRGITGRDAVTIFKGSGIKVVIVTHGVGHKEAGVFQFEDPGLVEELRQAGADVYIGTTVFESLDSAIKHVGIQSQNRLIADTLRMFGQGVKVCAEIATSAADAGFIPVGENVLCVAGTGKGADTVVLLRAENSKRFLDMEIIKILAKPKETKKEFKARCDYKGQ